MALTSTRNTPGFAAPCAIRGSFTTNRRHLSSIERRPRPLIAPRVYITRAALDADVAIVGAGVGGHGAALAAIAKGLKVVLFEGAEVGGTCVNRGCVPSKALLAASGTLRQMRSEHRLKALGLTVDGSIGYERERMAEHANGLAANVRANMTRSLDALGVKVVHNRARLDGSGTIVDSSGARYSVSDIILAPGSVPFVPRGVQLDGRTVFTSDEALRLESVPEWIAIVGSGYIGLEFADVYTALGCNVTFIEAADKLMPAFDPEIARVAQRLLINPRKIDWHTGVFASNVTPGEPGVKPVTIDLIDAGTKAAVDTLEVDAALIATGRAPNTADLGLETVNVETQRGFIPVDEHMRVLDTSGNALEHVYAIGDANGKMMLAHAASAQGQSAIENITGTKHTLDHNSVPAACFTHPEISMVGLTEPAAREAGEKGGFEVGKSVGHFRANSKALAEAEGDGIAKVLFNKGTGEILGVHIIGMHAADLIQECSNAMATGKTVRDLAYCVHTHPTLSEVVDEAFKGAVGMAAH